LDSGFELAHAVGLSDDGDVTECGTSASGVGGVDVRGGSAVAESVGLQPFIEERLCGGRGGGFVSWRVGGGSRWPLGCSRGGGR